MHNRLTSAIEACQQNWTALFPHIINMVHPGLLCMRVRPILADEVIEPNVLVDQEVTLVQLLGTSPQTKRAAGYCLLYEGASTIHQYTNYCSISYSDPTEVKFREPTVVYDDAWIRLIRFGLMPHDWFLGCRKKTEMQHVDLPASAAHQKFVGGWKDGA
ncbi:MAG: hypothetical protein WC505_05690 [Patescibacteria group bacterium]